MAPLILQRAAGVTGVAASFGALVMLRQAALGPSFADRSMLGVLPVAMPPLILGLACVGFWQRVHTFNLTDVRVLGWLGLSWATFLAALGCFVLGLQSEQISSTLGARWGTTIPAIFVLLGLGVCFLVLRSICSATYWAAKVLSLGKVEGEMRKRLSQSNQVLYLRSFTDDPSGAESPTSDPGPGLCLEGWFERRKWLFEEILAGSATPRGILLAVGFRNRYAFPLGCVRLAVADKVDWRDVVSSRIDDSAVVVLAMGTTPGLVWEIAQVQRRFPLDRVLLVNPRAFEKDKKECWLEFQKWAKSEMPLPSAADAPTVIGFKADDGKTYRAVVIESSASTISEFSRVFRRSIEERLDRATLDRSPGRVIGANSGPTAGGSALRSAHQD